MLFTPQAYRPMRPLENYIYHYLLLISVAPPASAGACSFFW